MKFEVAALKYDQVLYLDADIIVTKKLDAVFDVPREKVGVVKELNMIKDMFRVQHREKIIETINIDWEEKGFNAGMFVIYPDEWRDLKERALALISYFGTDVFSKSKCQQLLNIIFAGKTFDLSAEYNVSPVYDTHVKDPAIIHYLCEDKPWRSTYFPRRYYSEFRRNISLLEHPGILLGDIIWKLKGWR